MPSHQNKCLQDMPQALADVQLPLKQQLIQSDLDIRKLIQKEHVLNFIVSGTIDTAQDHPNTPSLAPPECVVAPPDQSHSVHARHWE